MKQEDFQKINKTKYTSPWTKFIFSNQELTEDPYFMYKDKIQYQIEHLIGSISKELLDYKQPDNVNFENAAQANRAAICLIMEQMLAIQYEHTPKEQAVMVSELFSHLPEVMDFKIDLVEKIEKGLEQKITLRSKLKQSFKKLINLKEEGLK